MGRAGVSLSRSYDADFRVNTETPASVATRAIVVAVGVRGIQRTGTPITARHGREVRPRGHEGPGQRDRRGDLRILIRQSPRCCHDSAR
jgi:hypothetical protein